MHYIICVDHSEYDCVFLIKVYLKKYELLLTDITDRTNVNVREAFNLPYSNADRDFFAVLLWNSNYRNVGEVINSFFSLRLDARESSIQSACKDIHGVCEETRTALSYGSFYYQSRKFSAHLQLCIFSLCCFQTSFLKN